jgi:cyclophilin family peptidyl-prolyl cis-trans isomerase
MSGGDGGIRTHDRVTPIHTFQACAFDHSATSPQSLSGRHAPSRRLQLSQGFAICHDARMKKMILSLTALALLATPATVDARKKQAKPIDPPSAPMPATKKVDVPSPGEIVAAAKAEEWVAIAPSDLLVMDLVADAKGKMRRVVIQLMPAPFSQGHIGNIRKLAAAKWWDGTSVNRVQDNYVVQWGDATEKKALPEGLAVVSESEYVTPPPWPWGWRRSGSVISEGGIISGRIKKPEKTPPPPWWWADNFDRWNDQYADMVGFGGGWPMGQIAPKSKTGDGVVLWPVHCYGMVGVGRDMSPNTGTGAELYTVIGHAPRHLDRNIALVGRVIEGIEHLSSLPRGTGALGFYEKAEERVPIASVRLMSEMENDKSLPAFEYLSTESESFAKYADARANRRDPFFIRPAGGADICNIPVPVRRKVR